MLWNGDSPLKCDIFLSENTILNKNTPIMAIGYGLSSGFSRLFSPFSPVLTQLCVLSATLDCDIKSLNC